ncbi:hypothetical protein QJQ45_003389 [Haematococcus lacustris]|nr:hypothetical protein QJQ45_003389 [Haematococcus lacustris]
MFLPRVAIVHGEEEETNRAEGGLQERPALPALGTIHFMGGSGKLWYAFLAAVLAQVKACSERAVIGSLLLSFLIRDLFTLHAADQLDEHGQPVYSLSGSHPEPKLSEFVLTAVPRPARRQ